MWFFAPPRACTRLPWRVPVSYTCRATGVLPTNETAATSGCANSASTAVAVTLHDVEDAVGEAGPLHQVGQDERGGRVLLRGLQHEAVAAGDGVGHHPQGDHDRKVEGRDAGDHPEGLEHRADVDARGDLRVGRALQVAGDAAGELDVLDAAGDLAPCVLEHLAVLAGHGCRELVPVGVEQLAQPEQETGPPGQGGGAPCARRLDRRLHGGVDLRGRWPGRPRPSGRRAPGRRRGRSDRTAPGPTSPRSSARSVSTGCQPLRACRACAHSRRRSYGELAE